MTRISNSKYLETQAIHTGYREVLVVEPQAHLSDRQTACVCSTLFKPSPEKQRQLSAFSAGLQPEPEQAVSSSPPRRSGPDLYAADPSTPTRPSSSDSGGFSTPTGTQPYPRIPTRPPILSCLRDLKDGVVSGLQLPHPGKTRHSQTWIETNSQPRVSTQATRRCNPLVLDGAWF